MGKRRTSLTLPSLKAVERSDGLLGRQVAQHLREAIVSGALKPGERLPSTRTLATSLGVARGTIVEVFDQLAAEGYLHAKVGAGTRVASALNVLPPVPKAAAASMIGHDSLLPPAAVRLATIVKTLAPQPPVPFAIAVPAAGIAPDDAWRRLGNRVRASEKAGPGGYSDPFGLPALRSAIAEHVRRARAVKCEPKNIIVTSGTQQGLYMAGRVLLTRGDAVWAENPAYHGLTAVLNDLEMRVHRVPVDDQGFDIEQALAACPLSRAAFVTPSHQ